MQTLHEVEGLHNCREFSQPLECLYRAMQTQDKSLLLLYKITYSKNYNAGKDEIFILLINLTMGFLNSPIKTLINQNLN